MQAKAHPFSLSKNIDSIVAGAIGFLIIQFFARHSGIGVSPDSVTYISTARNFFSGKGLIGFDAMPLVDFPAFYPVFLSAISFITRLDPLQYGAILNGLMFALLLYLCGSIMNAFLTSSKWYKRIVLSCLVFSPCLLEIYSMLWSETVFILLSVFFIVAIRNYFNTHSMRSLIIAAFVSALAFDTRYAGIVLLGIGGMLLVFDTYSSVGRRLLHIIVFSFISCSLLIINIIRNRLVSDSFAGERQKGVTPLIQNIYYFGNVLCDWLPVSKNNATAFIVTVVSIAACFIVFILFLRKRQLYYSYENIAAAFGIVYAVFMLLSATLSRYEQFTNRLLSPFFIPMLWSLSLWIPRVAERLHKIKKIAVIGLGALMTIGFQYNQFAADYETWDGVKDAGIPGYMEDPFPQSEIVQYIQKNKSMFTPRYTVYSNAGDAVYFFTGIYSHLLPQPVFPNEVRLFYMERFQYLVWFNNVDNPDLLSLEDILQNKKMKLVQQLNDGAVYRYDTEND